MQKGVSLGFNQHPNPKLKDITSPARVCSVTIVAAITMFLLHFGLKRNPFGSAVNAYLSCTKVQRIRGKVL